MAWSPRRDGAHTLDNQRCHAGYCDIPGHAWPCGLLSHARSGGAGHRHRRPGGGRQRRGDASGEHIYCQFCCASAQPALAELLLCSAASALQAMHSAWTLDVQATLRLHARLSACLRLGVKASYRKGHSTYPNSKCRGGLGLCGYGLNQLTVSPVSCRPGRRCRTRRRLAAPSFWP